MYLDQYKIPGSINNDQNPCFGNPETYPNFQEDLEKFKKDITRMVDENQSKTFSRVMKS